MGNVFQFFILLLGIVLCKSQSEPFELHPWELSEFAQEDRMTFVKFYAPWCGYCKEMAGDYNRLAEHFQDDSRVVIAQIDAYTFGNVNKEYGIRGYPTLKLFPGNSGQSVEADCGRDFESMKAYIEARLGNPPVQLNEDNFESIVLSNEKTVLVKFYSPDCTHCKKLAPTFQKLAQAFQGVKDIVIAEVDCEAYPIISEKFKIKEYPTIKLYDKENNIVKYTGNRKLEDLVKFVNSNNTGSKTAGPLQGEKPEEIGTKPEFDDLIKSFFSKPDDRERTFELAGAKARGTKDFASIYYIKSMEKMDAHGTEFISRELNRLKKILKSPLLEEQKKQELTIRRNILQRIAKLGKIPVDEQKLDL